MADAPARSVVSAGYAPLDIVLFGDRVWHAAGGTAGNVAAILGFLGWQSTLVAEIGVDLAGRTARQDLAQSNVAVRPSTPRTNAVTPRIIHEITRTGHRFSFKCGKCNQRLPSSRPLTLDRAREMIDEGLVPDVYFFDRLNAGTVLLAEHFARAGSLIAFEPSRPARDDFTDRALAVADIVKQADDRKMAVGDTGGRPGQIWVVTGGANGARYRVSRGAWHESPAFDYRVVDPGGAGDWTTSGLLHALPRSGRRTVAEIGDALRWAQALAAVSCGSPGARGLARQQSADAVVQAATLLEMRRAAKKQHTEGVEWSTDSPPRAVCGWCLQKKLPGTKTEIVKARETRSA